MIPSASQQLGFIWRNMRGKKFEDRYEELKAFKAKHGHCYVRESSKEDMSLGKWYSKVRQSRRKIESNEKPLIKLSEDAIKRLTAFGFMWNMREHYFNNRYEELKAFKAKHGHCYVNESSKEDMFLGQWCSRVRQSRRKIGKPLIKLSEDEIKRLTGIGFIW